MKLFTRQLMSIVKSYRCMGRLQSSIFPTGLKANLLGHISKFKILNFWFTLKFTLGRLYKTEDVFVLFKFPDARILIWSLFANLHPNFIFLTDILWTWTGDYEYKEELWWEVYRSAWGSLLPRYQNRQFDVWVHQR